MMIFAPALMPAGFIEPCSSIASGNPPSGPNLLDGMKHDGYRLIVRKASSPRARFHAARFRVTGRFPAITIFAHGAVRRSRPVHVISA
jgi:hypothetical protein